MAIFDKFEISQDMEGVQDWYCVISAGTDYALDDKLMLVETYNPTTGAAGVTLWFNATQRAWLAAAPANTDIERCAPYGNTDTEIEEKFETDLTTGEIKEILQVTAFNEDGSIVTTYLYNGAVYVPSGTVADEPVRVNIGREAVTGIVVGTDSALAAVPTFATHAEIHVWDAAVVVTTDGTTPNPAGAVGTRQNDGANFELQSRSEIDGLTVQALVAGTTAGLSVEYFNKQKHN